jgi:hypothetical protein
LTTSKAAQNVISECGTAIIRMAEDRNLKEVYFMKIIKALLLQSLILASMIVAINVSAADQSICNPGTNVLLNDDGSLRACQLKDDYDVNNIQCKNDGQIVFYNNGNLESCVLSASITIGKNDCQADALISFYSDGNLKSCMKQD